jgi:hypothetical protein
MMPTISLEKHHCNLALTRPPSIKPFLFTFFIINLNTPLFLDWTLFAHALTIIPHLLLVGLFEMVYEHLWGCFIPKDLFSRFLKVL